MLLLSTIGLVVPAVFHRLAHGGGSRVELKLDTEIAVVLFADPRSGRVVRAAG